MKPRIMPCADEAMTVRTFLPNGDTVAGKPDYSCEHCGWAQTSSPEGARQLVENATWHDLETRKRYARIAVSAGYKVPKEFL